jgi:glutathione peroxidase
MSLYDFAAQSIDNQPVALSQYKGQVMLIVNTASACGFTPQFAGLEKRHQTYGDKGLVVLGFPCNQFASQDPGDDAQIANFCQKNYGVSFQMMSKIQVKGDGAHPLYQWLTAEAPGILGSKAIKWNFTKFLVGRDGRVIKRYAPQAWAQGDVETLARVHNGGPAGARKQATLPYADKVRRAMR